MSDKVLDRVSKLLAQAENAGTPEEAEAFMAGAQRQAAQNGIDLALARLHQAKKEKQEEPEERRIQVNPYSRIQNRKHFLELAMHVADVNDLKYLIGGKEYTLHAVGFPSDLDAFEALYVHLSIQMVLECDAALKAGGNRETKFVPKQVRETIPDDEIQWGEWSDNGEYCYNDYPEHPNSKSYDPPKTRLVHIRDADGMTIFEERSVAVTDGRVFRHEFYGAFASRIHAKLWGAKRQAMADAGEADEGSGNLALAVRDKKAEVDAASEEQRAKVHHLGTYSGSDSDDRGYDRTGAGRTLGRQAAEATAVGGSRGIEG